MKESDQNIVVSVRFHTALDPDFLKKQKRIEIAGTMKPKNSR